MFSEDLGDLNREIKYCSLGKCKNETKEGAKVVRKGQIVPQALRAKTTEYIKDLVTRNIIWDLTQRREIP